MSQNLAHGLAVCGLEEVELGLGGAASVQYNVNCNGSRRRVWGSLVNMSAFLTKGDFFELGRDDRARHAERVGYDFVVFVAAGFREEEEQRQEVDALRYGANPEEPPPCCVFGNGTRNNGTDEGTNEVAAAGYRRVSGRLVGKKGRGS